MIDLRSDTVTHPSDEMRRHMATAPVGDDAYGEDPSVTALEKRCKELFQKEDALFVTSGMMANRLAFMSQTTPGDEVITECTYHVNFFDSAPMAALAGVVMNPRQTPDGILRPADVLSSIYSKQRYDYFAQPRLISVENSINGCAGKIFPFETLEALYALAQEEKISLHLDGARLFNAHTTTKIPLHTYAKYTDTLSVCFSKGLGAPYGSVLMGPKEVLDRARKYRLWLGGGIHQGGMLAAGAHYAIDNQLADLKNDHAHAALFAKELSEIETISFCHTPVETNIVQFSITDSADSAELFLNECHNLGLQLFPWLPTIFRAVFHRGITKNDVTEAIAIIKNVTAKLQPMAVK